MKKLNQNGSIGIIEIALIIIVFAAIAGVGYYVVNKSKGKEAAANSTSTSTPVRTEAEPAKNNPTVEALLAGIPHTRLGIEVPSEFCTSIKNLCYKGTTTLVAIQYPVLKKFDTFVVNLEANQWQGADGTKVSQIIERDRMTDDKDESIFEIPDLRPVISDKLLYNGKRGIHMISIPKDSLQSNEDISYIESLIFSKKSAIDYVGLGKTLDDNSFILSISQGDESEPWY